MKKDFFFIHIPKTAGGTFRRIIESIYGKECKRVRAVQAKDWYFGRVVGMPQKKSGIGEYPVMSGHIETRIVEDHNYELITLVREPVERIISAYFYLRYHNKIPNVSIVDYAKKHSNRQAEIIVDLNKFSFVGLKECFDETLERFSVWANVTIPKYENYNIGITNSTSLTHGAYLGKKPVSKNIRNKIAELNKDDYKIWWEICERYGYSQDNLNAV